MAWAAGTMAFMAALAVFFDGMGLLIPLIPPFAVAYWGLALTTICCAIVALGRRQWRSGIGALAVIMVSLLPSVGILYECSRGNCF